MKQLVNVFLCKMLYLFNNKITPVLYNQKVFSPLIVISNCLCFTCAADANLQWVETWLRTVNLARKHGAIPPIHLCIPAENWCAGTFGFRENTCLTRSVFTAVGHPVKNWHKCADFKRARYIKQQVYTIEAPKPPEWYWNISHTRIQIRITIYYAIKWWNSIKPPCSIHKVW